jgi:A/G-specific adenine glycosylase
LLEFYRRQRRDLPWRRTRDPYAIWVSEIMLQQTQVDTVAPRYGRFLAEFPTVAALAASTEARVCEAWAGLGYYRRARHLHRAAAAILDEHGGVVPRDVATLMALPGIGRYTAGAIASIAYDVAAPIVDGNVARVFARLFALPGAPNEPRLQKRLWQLAEELVIGAAPGDLNQAIMDLGATVCTPVAPACSRCPLARWCAAKKLGRPERFPEKKARSPVQRLDLAFAYVEESGGVWLMQRPLTGLWAGLWEPPSAQGPGARAALARTLGRPVGRELGRVEHQLSHRAVVARVFHARAPAPVPEGWRLVADPLEAPISVLAKKAILAGRAGRRLRKSSTPRPRRR